MSNVSTNDTRINKRGGGCVMERYQSNVGGVLDLTLGGDGGGSIPGVVVSDETTTLVRGEDTVVGILDQSTYVQQQQHGPGLKPRGKVNSRGRDCVIEIKDMNNGTGGGGGGMRKHMFRTEQFKGGGLTCIKIIKHIWITLIELLSITCGTIIYPIKWAMLQKVRFWILLMMGIFIILSLSTITNLVMFSGLWGDQEGFDRSSSIMVQMFLQQQEPTAPNNDFISGHGDELLKKKPPDKPAQPKLHIVHKETLVHANFVTIMKGILMRRVLRKLNEYLSELSIKFNTDAGIVYSTKEHGEKEEEEEEDDDDDLTKEHKVEDEKMYDVIKINLGEIVKPHVMDKLRDRRREKIQSPLPVALIDLDVSGEAEGVDEGDLELRSTLDGLILEVVYELFQGGNSEYRCCCKFKKNAICSEKRKLPLLRQDNEEQQQKDEPLTGPEFMEQVDMQQLSDQHLQYLRLIKKGQMNKKIWCWLSILENTLDEKKYTVGKDASGLHHHHQTTSFQTIEKEHYLYIYIGDNDVVDLKDLSCTLTLVMDEISSNG